MTDYTRVFTFADKDALTTGDPNKIIKGADVDSELDAVVTAVATKVDEPATPADGQVLTYNGSAYVSVGGYTFVETQTAASDTSLDFTLETGFDYRFVFQGVHPTTDDQPLLYEVREAAVWIATTNAYSLNEIVCSATGTASTQVTQTDNGNAFAGSVGNEQAQGVQGYCDVMAADQVLTPTFLIAHARAETSAGVSDFRMTHSERTALAVATDIRFRFASNMLAGTITQYQIRRTS